jgi:hypothetical protein
MSRWWSGGLGVEEEVRVDGKSEAKYAAKHNPVQGACIKCRQSY